MCVKWSYGNDGDRGLCVFRLLRVDSEFLRKKVVARRLGCCLRLSRADARPDANDDAARTLVPGGRADATGFAQSEGVSEGASLGKT
jgi:hypothetical protein